MAVYTHLSDENLDQIREGFGLGEIIAFKGIAEGVQNSNFILETKDSRYILTIYENMVDVKDLPFFLGATEMASDMGLPCARPVRTKCGELTFNIAGKTCALCSFLSGYSPRYPSAKQTRAAGAALAKLHLAMRDYDLTRENDLDAKDWPQMWEKLRGAGEELEKGAAALIDEDVAQIKKSWPDINSDLPKGFIHADLFADNVLFVGDEVSGLIDFYFSANGFYAYDLAIMLNAWCFLPLGREFELTKGRALINGYESVRKLSDREKELIPLFARGAAIRFYLTRLSDWVRNDGAAIVIKKDPKEYSARLAFHRAAKNIFDYGGL